MVRSIASMRLCTFVRDADVDAVILRVRRDGRRGRSHELVERFLDARFADAEQLQGPRTQDAALAEGRLDLLLPHSRHLARHAGHRHDPLALAPDVPARRRAERIRERACGRDEPGLLPVSFRHRRSAAGEPGSQLRLERRIDRRRFAERRGDRLAGEVVLGRAETAGGDDEVAPLDRSPERLGGPAEVVADGRHVHEVDPEARQPCGQIRRICVDDLTKEQLGADGQELGAQFGPPSHAVGTGIAPRPPTGSTSQPFPSSPRSPAPVAGFCGSKERIGWGVRYAPPWKGPVLVQGR
jgi:hypothetical protein